MSNSRLEKFIYAICSMEVSDLPAPLSRIEKLWNCLITGETPDFEPLSRNEKYLMAMLDRYDISNLPAPMSRGEKLLYKIAVGETDLSDVPEYLSRYEELLKYLIENGGIGFEYVLYTLNQSLSTLYATVEKPVKSAILSGQTLVNLAPKKIIEYTASSDWDGFNILVQNSKKPNEHWRTLQDLKPNTKYYISCYVETFEDVNGRYYLFNNSNQNCLFVDSMKVNGVGHYQWISTTRSELTDGIFIALRCQNAYARGAIKIRDIMIIEYQEGMENWEIPYFTGMQSVKMPVLTTTGKNLFDGNMVKGTVMGSTGQVVDNSSDRLRSDYIPVNGNSFTVSCATNKWVGVFAYRKDKTYIGYKSSNGYATYKTNENIGFVVISTEELNDFVNNIQLEEGSNATPYEPYKSNILSTPSDLELRGIGAVKDTLDCLTCEVTERIGETVLDGSEVWNLGSENETYIECYTMLSSQINPLIPNNGITNNDFIVASTGWKKRVALLKGAIYITIEKNNASSIEELKSYLQSNPIIVQYQLATESIKTVDLTTVDQDGQPTKLKTFNDITYVEIKADNLIPSVDLEVATKINEALSTMGPQQFDISNTQNQLGQTIEEQTENTDATMMATTEIYEQTL